MPDGYGVPERNDGLVDWIEVEQRLAEATVFWMATTRPDGRPHVVPRWGVWLDRRFWYDGSRDTIHARNLRGNPACTLHLEDGTQAVIVEGTSRPADVPIPSLGHRLSKAFCGKYESLGYRPEPDAWNGPDAGGLTVFTPLKVLAWFDFPNDVTRFSFERARGE